MLKRARRILFWAGVAAALAPSIYDAIAPPVVHWHATAWAETDDIITVHLDVLSLKDCHYIAGDTVGQVHENGVWRRTNITVNRKPGVLPPFGWADMGEWKWQKVKPSEVVDRVLASANFVCGDAPVTVNVGPLDIHDPII